MSLHTGGKKLVRCMGHRDIVVRCQKCKRLPRSADEEDDAKAWILPKSKCVHFIPLK